MRTIQEVMDLEISTLELSVRITNAVARLNLKTLADLTRLKKEDYLKMRGFGKTSLGQLEVFFNETGLSFGMSDLDWLHWGLAHIDWIKAH